MSSDAFKSPNVYVGAGKLHHGSVLLLIKVLAAYVLCACWSYVSVVFVCGQRLYISTARQLKRIDAVRKSPLYSHLDESVTGIASIRAYDQVAFFVRRCDRLINESQRAWYLFTIIIR